ncbi:hypothetical protein OOU_Y34scaffold00215g2 [Pyricularia oryzae Y34]|uniref:cytidine deaminase n=2 Tax=Pyricularia oryzae TaxID=318829 RepID=A0AA97P5C4_PYRO3|nr:hypothetical protein OOU_Y34scaffold00215g2 [Pyricularia oryzae Y34]
MVACLPHNGTCLTTSASVLHEGIACDKAASSDAYKDLVDSVASRHPNTKVIPYPFSVAKEDETLALIDELLNTFGRLDIWVCSSGFLGPPSISDTTPDVLQKCFESQSLAPFFALKYAPPAMAKLCAKQSYPNAAPKAQAYGSIVVIASVASTYGGCWGPCHTMMAHASLGVVRAGVSVLKGTGVRINCISAGQIETGVDLKGVDMRGMNVQFPPANLQSKEVQQATVGLERAGHPQEVARVAGFLASGFSSYITGANLVVDGGASLNLARVKVVLVFACILPGSFHVEELEVTCISQLNVAFAPVWPWLTPMPRAAPHDCNDTACISQEAVQPQSLPEIERLQAVLHRHDTLTPHHTALHCPCTMSLPPSIQKLSSSDDAAVDEVCKTYGISREQFQQLQRRSEAAKSTAYCPYSNFRVGATLLSIDDKNSYISGANVENASYPVGTCAERVALGKAVTEGHRRFRALAVSTDITPPASPCGMCRQFIREFSDLHMPIFMFDKDNDFVVMKLEALLPLSFGPEQLPRAGSAGAAK